MSFSNAAVVEPEAGRTGIVMDSIGPSEDAFDRVGLLLL